MAIGPICLFVALLMPLCIGVILVRLIMAMRRTYSYHEGRRIDMHNLHEDVAKMRKELQEIKEYLADVTIQLDDQRSR